MKGLFIVLEGGEGSGKTTIAEALVRTFRSRGLDLVHAREPGGTDVGELIRKILLQSMDVVIPPVCELLLFLAARNAFVEGVVKPALERGELVIADRFDLSTMAYQIAGRGLPEVEALAANAFAKDGLSPDLYILLQVDEAASEKRQRRQGKTPDRMELAGREFHQRVREGYDYFAAELPNVEVLDTSELTEAEVLEAVLDILQARFSHEFNIQEEGE